METILHNIAMALESDLPYVALASTLTLPDICAALESADGETTGAKYREWYKTWLAPKYPLLSACDAWRLRCGVVHEGRAGHRKMQYNRVVFAVHPTGTAHNNIVNGALNLDLKMFCNDVMDAVMAWYAAKKQDPNVQAHLPGLVQYRSEGFGGLQVPVIA